MEGMLWLAMRGLGRMVTGRRGSCPARRSPADGGGALDEMLGELRRTMMERTWAGVAIGGLAARWRMRVEKSPG